jgi:hypothetical protein
VLHRAQEDVKDPRQDRHRTRQPAALYGHGLCVRRATTGLATAAVAVALDQDDAQYPEAIAESVQVAHPVEPGMLEARNLRDEESTLRNPHMDQRLDLEAVAPQPPVAPARRRRGGVEVQYRDVLPPEHVEAVAEV